MKSLKKYIGGPLLLFMLMLLSNSSEAQNRLSISSTGSKSLEFKPVSRPGHELKFFEDDTKWLNYSIVLDQNEPSYSVSVQIVSGKVPDGFDLMLTASEYVGSNQCKAGIPVGKIKLSNTPQVIIDNIGTSYTGAGPRVGHHLVYSVEIRDLERLRDNFPTISLLYTISQ